MTTDTRQAKILDGKATARAIRAEVATACAALKQRTGVVPGLTVVLIGQDPASQIYVRNKARMADKAGIHSAVLRLPATASQQQILDTVAKLNDDADVHGILVQLPLPDDVDDQRVIEAIDRRKDVDGFHPENVGRLWTGLPGFVPCTPAGIIELLRRHDVPLKGQRAVIIGRSNIVGKPMAALLIREHCTVTVCHSRTRDLAQVAADGDILIAAVGRAGLVTGEFIRPGAAVVDVGIHRIEDRDTCRDLFGDNSDRLAAFDAKGHTLVGDVHPRQASERAGWLSPVPGGVGPLTIALLLRNTVDAATRLSG